jgi:hypothetical protein
LHFFEVRREPLSSYYRVAVVDRGELPTTDQWNADSSVGFQVDREMWRRFYNQVPEGGPLKHVNERDLYFFQGKSKRTIRRENGESFVMETLSFSKT